MTGKTALDEVQTAIATILKADGTFMGLISGLYDHVPQNKAFPYVVLGTATEIPFDVFGKDGKEQTFTIHIWSRYEGFKEAYTILDRLNVVLDQAALTVTGHTLVYCHYENTDALRDPDGITRHLVIRYRIIAQDT